LDTAIFVGWRALTWLSCNLGVQALPIIYLWAHRHDKSPAFWEYVNCTLAILIALGMLVAAVSDMITERAILGAKGWVAILACIGGAIATLHRAAHDEFIKKVAADWELFLGSAGFAALLVLAGTFLKLTIWYNQRVGESAGGRPSL
jgi:hypothetical protein